MRKFGWIFWTVALCAAARLAFADSLWPGQEDSLYKDKKAFKIGDVLTVIVQEAASASHQANTQAKKSSSTGVTWGSSRSNSAFPLTDIGLTGKQDMNGGGKSIRSGALNGRITLRVKEVLPNGNLVINGTRNITVNDEKQVLEITGIVRPEDVTAENSVLSSLVADAQIKYTGKGEVSEKARMGFFSRLLSMFWIF